MRSILASIIAAIAVALSLAAPSPAANQALMLNGIGGGADLPDMVMSNVLGGMFGSYERQNVLWPQQAKPISGTKYTLQESVDIGADNLGAAITQALTRLEPGEHVTIVGLSAGALVVDEQLRRLAAAGNPIDESKLNAVVIGDSSRSTFNLNRFDPFLNYTYAPPAETPYATTSVTAMYDGFADFPDRPTNILAVANAMAGELLLHVPGMFDRLPMAPAASRTVTSNAEGGVTTTYLLKPAHLPLVQLNPWLTPLEPTLTTIIDSAYVRNDTTTAAAKKPAAVTVATATVAETSALPSAVARAAESIAAPAQAISDSADVPRVVKPHRGPAASTRGPAPKPAAATRGRK